MEITKGKTIIYAKTWVLPRGEQIKFMNNMQSGSNSKLKTAIFYDGLNLLRM